MESSTSKNLNVNLVSDFQNEVSDVMFNRNVLEKYNFAMDSLIVEKEGIKDFLKVLGKFYAYERVDLPVSKKQTIVVITFENDWMVHYFDTVGAKEYSISIYAADYSIGAKILDIFKEYELHIEENIVILTNLYYEQGRLREDTRVLKDETFKDLRKTYYPYLDVDAMFKQFTKSSENILMLTGIPGIGKTKIINLYMSYLLENAELLEDDINRDDEDIYGEVNEIFVLHVKSEELLATDTFWSYLAQNNRYALVILDDFDNFLAPRTNEIMTENDLQKNKFISNFLSQTDGTIENNIKFIITTNRDVKEVDTALLRKGRAFDVLCLRKLTYAEAERIWTDEGFDKEEFSAKFKGAEEISQAEVGSEIALKRTFGEEEVKEYLLEEDISLLKKLRRDTRRKKRIGIE